MRSGICPKCKADAVYATNAHNTNFTLPENEQETFIGKMVSVQAVASERYVCTNCGYFETYVASREILKSIPNSSAWIKV